MLDSKPDNYTDITQWFLHFRLTKHLPGMQTKLQSAMKLAPDAKAKRFVMTAYAAASLDVAFYLPYRPATELAQHLEELCGVKPFWLQGLSVHEIAAPMKVTAEELEKKLETAGFRIDEDGIIMGHLPPPPKPSLKPRNPYPSIH